MIGIIQIYANIYQFLPVPTSDRSMIVCGKCFSRQRFAEELNAGAHNNVPLRPIFALLCKTTKEAMVV